MTDRDSAPPPTTSSSGLGGVVNATVGRLGHRLGKAFLHPRRRAADTRRVDRTPGASAGMDSQDERHEPPPLGAVRLRCTDYGPDRIHDLLVEDLDVAALDAFLEAQPPEDCSVRWIDVEGLHPYVVERLRVTFGLHTLAAEDVLHVPQRPKAGDYDDQLFAVTDLMSLEDGMLVTEQMSFFLLPGLLISFQEWPPDAWAPIRARLARPDARLRAHGADYLLYALLDAVVDHAFPVLERLGDRLESLELDLLEAPSPELLGEVHAIKRDLLAVRRVMWPTRQLVDVLRRDEHGRLSEDTLTYLRDVYEHNIQIIDIVETYRELASGLTDLYMSALSNRMNEIMKVLTIIATMFIPITFLAGVYGMNFRVLPELGWRYGYAGFWVVCALVVAGLLVFFRRRGWLG